MESSLTMKSLIEPIRIVDSTREIISGKVYFVIEKAASGVLLITAFAFLPGQILYNTFVY